MPSDCYISGDWICDGKNEKENKLELQTDGSYKVVINLKATKYHFNVDSPTGTKFKWGHSTDKVIEMGKPITLTKQNVSDGASFDVSDSKQIGIHVEDDSMVTFHIQYNSSGEMRLTVTPRGSSTNINVSHLS